MSRIVADTPETEEQGLHIYLNSEDGTLEIIKDVDTLITSIGIDGDTHEACVKAGIDEV